VVEHVGSMHEYANFYYLYFSWAIWNSIRAILLQLSRNYSSNTAVEIAKGMVERTGLLAFGSGSASSLPSLTPVSS
jgi:hypothetical protein